MSKAALCSRTLKKDKFIGNLQKMVGEAEKWLGNYWSLAITFSPVSCWDQIGRCLVQTSVEPQQSLSPVFWWSSDQTSK